MPVKKWLLDSDAKRCIYLEIYGDLIDKGGVKMLDVGGGLTTLGRLLSEKNDYYLLDICAHESDEEVNEFIKKAPKVKHIKKGLVNKR